MSSVLTPWLEREFLSQRNSLGAALSRESNSEPKRLQLVTAKGYGEHEGEKVIWCDMADGALWIDCCIPSDVLTKFNSTRAKSFESSSASKCLFRVLSYRFLLARPLIPDYTSPRKPKLPHLAVPAPPVPPKCKPPRICLWIDRFEYYAYGNSSLKNAYLSFRRWGGNPNDPEQEKRRAQERVGWVTRIEKQARETRHKVAATTTNPATTEAAPPVAFLQDLQQGTSDPKPRPRKPSPEPVPPATIVSESSADTPIVKPPVSNVAVELSALPAPAAAAAAAAPRPAMSNSAWPAPDEPLPRVDWTQTRARLDRLEAALRRIPAEPRKAEEEDGGAARPVSKIEAELTVAAAGPSRASGSSPKRQVEALPQHNAAMSIRMDWSAAERKMAAVASASSMRPAGGPTLEARTDGSVIAGGEANSAVGGPALVQTAPSGRALPPSTETAAEPTPNLLGASANAAVPPPIAVPSPSAPATSPTRKQAIRTDWAAAQARIADLQKAKAKALAAAAALPSRSMYAAAPDPPARVLAAAETEVKLSNTRRSAEGSAPPAKRPRTMASASASHGTERDERDASIFSQAEAASPPKNNGALFRSPSPAAARSPSPTRSRTAAIETPRRRSPSINTQRSSSPLTSLEASSEPEEDIVMESVEPEEQVIEPAVSPTSAAVIQQVPTASPVRASAAGLVEPKAEEPAERDLPLDHPVQESECNKSTRELSHRSPLQAKRERRQWRIKPELFDLGLWCQANGLQVR